MTRKVIRAYRVTQEILADALQVGDGRSGEQAPHDLAIRIHHLWREILVGSHVVLCDDLTPVQRWGVKKYADGLQVKEADIHVIKRANGVTEADAENITRLVEDMARTAASCSCALSEYPRVATSSTAAKVTVTLRLSYLPLSKGK